MYEELDEEDLIRLACRHLNRGQELPQGLMNALEGLGIADTFKNITDETDA